MKQVVFLEPHHQMFAGLAPGPKTAVREALKQLAAGEPSLDVKRLKGFEEPALYRLRLHNHRIVYYEQGDRIVVMRVFHRSVGYEWLE